MFKVYSGILYQFRAEIQLWKGTTQFKAHFFKLERSLLQLLEFTFFFPLLFVTPIWLFVFTVCHPNLIVCLSCLSPQFDCLSLLFVTPIGLFVFTVCIQLDFVCHTIALFVFTVCIQLDFFSILGNRENFKDICQFSRNLWILENQENLRDFFQLSRRRFCNFSRNNTKSVKIVHFCVERSKFQYFQQFLE